MKVLDLNSSLGARKELAKELGYTGDTNDSAKMNVWLHKQVMIKLAANGGKVPDELKYVRRDRPQHRKNKSPPSMAGFSRLSFAANDFAFHLSQPQLAGMLCAGQPEVAQGAVVEVERFPQASRACAGSPGTSGSVRSALSSSNL